MSLNAIKTSTSPHVTLQIGERRFTTLRDTLVGESNYFAARLSGRWNDAEADGSYFIDSNPALFEHVLGYLRNGTFPLFFDSVTQTFHYAKYLSLLTEARYFGIHKLEEWIEEKRYLEAVKIQQSIEVIEDVLDQSGCLENVESADTNIQISTSWTLKKVYICPRNIEVHRGDPSKCGRACEKTREDQGGHTKYEEEPVLRAIIKKTKLVFDPATCLGTDGL